MNAREEPNIHSLSACQKATGLFWRRNDEYDEYERLGQLGLFVVSLLRDDTPITENVLSVCVCVCVRVHHSSIC